MKTIEVKRQLVEEILDQLKGAQQDCYVESTEMIIDEVKVVLRQPDVSGRSELLFAFIAEVKKEFADQNWDYLDFIAERVIKANNSH
jgi:hypothetical protein